MSKCKSYIYDESKSSEKYNDDYINKASAGHKQSSTTQYLCNTPQFHIGIKIDKKLKKAKIQAYKDEAAKALADQKIKKEEHDGINEVLNDKEFRSSKIEKFEFSDGNYINGVYFMEKDDCMTDEKFKEKCCKCADTKKGGSINLTKSQAQDLKTQLIGITNKSTKILYGGERAKILGIDNSRNLIIQTENAIHRINTNNVKVHNKYVL